MKFCEIGLKLTMKDSVAHHMIHFRNDYSLEFALCAVMYLCAA